MSMPDAAGRFLYPRTSEVVYGIGSLAELSRLVEQLEASRVFAITSSSLMSGGVGDQLRAVLGSRLVGVHASIPQHVPRNAVIHAASAAREAGANILVSVGGGTPIDAAKAVALCLSEGIGSEEQLDAYRVRFTYPDRLEVPALPESVVPHVAIPTTLSGAEHTNLCGVTDTRRRVKDLLMGNALCPDAVILDAGLAQHTPGWLWASSAVRALDHAIEGTLSKRHVPFMDALGLESIRLLRRWLIPSLRDRSDYSALTQCQLAAWLAIYALPNVGSGLSHAIGHQLAAEFDIIHGVTSAIMLPHVMRFNASVTADRLVRLAEPFGVPSVPGDDEATSERVVDALVGFIEELEQFGVPHTLSAAGGRREAFGGVADHVLQDVAAASSVRPVSRADVMGMLEAAW